MDSVDFSLWLDRLRELPSDAPQWQHAGEFVDTLAQLIAEKELERARADELIAAVTGIKERFSDEWVFLGIDIEGLLRIPTLPPNDTRQVLSTASRLENALIELREAQSTTFERLRIAAEGVQGELNTLSEALAESESSDIDLGDSELTLTSGDHSEDPTVDSVRTADGHYDAQAGRTSTEDRGESEVPTKIEEPMDDSSTPDEPSKSLSTEDQESSGLQRADSSKAVNGNLEHPRFAEEESSQVDGGEDNRPHGIVVTSKAAKCYLESSTLKNLETLMWALVGEDDLTAAYWMAEYLTQQHYVAAVPPPLLKAVLGSRSLSPDSSRYVEDLFNVAREYDDTDTTSAQGLLELAASLGSSLIAPHSMMLGLLKTPVACPAAGGLVAAVDEFARTGEPLRPEYIKGMGESVRRQDAIDEASVRAKSWLEDAPKRKYSSQMWATNVWKHLTGPSGKISEMLAPVIRNDITKARLVNTTARKWPQQVAIDDVNQINQFLGEGKSPRPQITGHARNWLLNGIDEASSLAVKWCELVLYENEVREGTKKNNLIQLVHSLRNEVERHARQVVQALSELTTEANPTEIASAARCALRTVDQVCRAMDIDVDYDVPQSSEVVDQLNVINRDAATLDALVSRRLLWTKATGIVDDGTWSGESLEQVVCDLAESVVASVSQDDAIAQRFRLQDYRFLNIMSTGLEIDQRETIMARCNRARQDSEMTLKNYARDMGNRIDQAVRDGVIDIDDDNWINYKLSVGDVENSLEAEEDIFNFPPKLSQLESVQEGLQSEEHRRHSQLTDEWNKELSNLADTCVPAIEAWREKFDAARASRNIRVMEECVIRLRNHSVGETLPEPSLTDEQYEQDVKALSEFVAFIENIPDVEEYARSSIGLTSLESELAST